MDYTAMGWFVQPLLFFLAQCTRNQLIRQIEFMMLAYRSPNLNAYVERFVQSIQRECLDHFLIFSERHFDYLVRKHVEHYHREQPHQGLENRPLCGEPPPAPPDRDGEIRCRTRPVGC